MKYIRTKCGKIVKNLHPNAEVFTFRYEIEKQADTIEELCDTFVFSVDQGRLEIESFTKAKEYYNSGKKENMIFSLFGAIWTDKGLIYVAKMNDKGELELL